MAERYRLPLASGRDSEPPPAAPAIAFLAVLAGGAIATLIGIVTHPALPGAIGGLLVLIGAWLRRGSRDLGKYVLLIGVGFAAGAAAATALRPLERELRYKRRVSAHETTAFRPVPRTGVIYVTTEAGKQGFRAGDPEWCNLGQGQPETGPLAGAPDRREAIAIHGDDQEYAPVAGLWELREAVAGFYNQLYRRGMPSQYSAENVAISGGGRTALTRAAASLGQINLGHFLPDYTAYEELLDVFRLFSPIPIALEGDRAYEFTATDLRKEILGRGLSAILLSNPSNPTGKLISGDELADWVQAARALDCSLLIDEFYSHYVWKKRAGEPSWMVSAARYVEDVERDPIVIFDGLTKNWRYPGWRTTWTVGPRSVIEAVGSAGSFLDGGGCKPMQRAAIELMTLEHAQQETDSIRAAFVKKRDLMMRRVREMGMTLDREPDGTFYAWVNLGGLPAAISDGMTFFRAALERKVITVPGEFFDVNPGKRRAGRVSRFRRHSRLSFGPSYETVATALERIGDMIAAHQK